MWRGDSSAMRRSWRRGLAAHPREGTAGFGGGLRQRRAAGAECAGPSGADASSLPWLSYRLLYCGCVPEPPSPAAGRPSPQASPSWQMGPGPSEATYSSHGSQRAGRIVGEPGGTVSGRSTRQKDGKARHLTRQEARSLAGQAACSGTGPRQQPAACPQTAAGRSKGTAGLGTARQPPCEAASAPVS